MALTLYLPRLAELRYRQSLLADEATMAYNRAWGGTVDFPPEKWETWYARWTGAEDRFYRYLWAEELSCPVGEIALRHEDGRWLCDVIVEARHRGRGFGTEGLALLCAEARRRGIARLYDEIAVDNPSLRLFLRAGFREVGRTKEAVCVVKDL